MLKWIDEKGIDPLFPFGYGLSYTEFEYDNIQIDRGKLAGPEDSLTINVDVTNIGERSGADTIQVYAHDSETSLVRPPQELAGFEKVHLESGERKTASVKIHARDLAFYDIEIHDWKIEPGDFELQIGRSSRDRKLKTSISYS